MTSQALIDEIDRIAEYKLQPFLAPIVDADTSYVFTVQGDAPYFLRVDKASPGWWIVNPTSNHTAELDRVAMPHEYLPYLAQLPRFLVYVLFKTGETTWMCSPMNSADTSQRGWADLAKPMHLVRENLVPLEVVKARLVGDILLFSDTMATRAMQADLCPNKDLRNAAKIINVYRNQVKEERRKHEEATTAISLEEGFKWRLQFASADLDGWRELPQGYEIRYSISGVEMPPIVLGKDGKVITAGICLDGTDRYHNLTSIVHVMQRARELRRFDLDEELWI